MNWNSATRSFSLIAGMSSLLAPGASWASGFALLEQSASRLGNAFAGTTVVAEDASAMFYNPASLSQLDRSQFVLSATGVSISSEFQNSNSQAALGQPLGTNGGDAGDWNGVPSAYFAMPIDDRLAFGFGFNVPFGLKLEYPDDWIGRFQSLNSEIQTYNFNPALSWQINEVVTIGLGINYQRIQAELTNAVNYTGVVAAGLQQLVLANQVPAQAVPGLLAANAGLQSTTYVRGDDDAWGYNFGATFQVSPTTRLGIAYRSSVDYEVEGTVRFDPPNATDPIGAAIIASATGPGGQLANGAVSVELELPDIATASLSQKLGDRVELLADIAWTGWSSIQELAVVRTDGTVLSTTPEQWDDTLRFALGLSYELNTSLTLRAGLAFDETPVPDETRTARLPDPDRTWVSIGARWDSGDAFVIDAGYAHLFSDDVPLDQDQDNIPAYGLLNGQQNSAVDIVGVQVGYRF